MPKRSYEEAEGASEEDEDNIVFLGGRSIPLLDPSINAFIISQIANTSDNIVTPDEVKPWNPVDISRETFRLRLPDRTCAVEDDEGVQAGGLGTERILSEQELGIRQPSSSSSNSSVLSSLPMPHLQPIGGFPAVRTSSFAASATRSRHPNHTNVQFNVLNPNNSTVTLLDIFLQFLPPDVLELIWDSYPESHWTYQSGPTQCRILGGKANMRGLYSYLAVYVRSIGILGQQNGEEEEEEEEEKAEDDEQGNKRPLRKSIKDCLDYFKRKFIDQIDDDDEDAAAERERLRATRAAQPILSEATAFANLSTIRDLGPIQTMMPLTVGNPIHRLTQSAINTAFEQEQLRVQKENQQQEQEEGKEKENNGETAEIASSSSTAVSPQQPLSTLSQPTPQSVNPHPLFNSANHIFLQQAIQMGHTINITPLPGPIPLRADRIMPGYDLMEKIWSRFHIRDHCYSLISQRFQQFLHISNDELCCSEQIVGFPGGNNGMITFTHHRTLEKIGLYFFTCHTMLYNTSDRLQQGNSDIPTTYLLHGDIFACNPKQGKIPNLHERVSSWTEVYERFKLSNPKLRLSLHYNTVKEENLSSLQQRNVDFSAMMNPGKCVKLNQILHGHSGKLRQRGDYTAVYRQDHQEIFYSYWDSDASIGKRSYFSNLYQSLDTGRGGMFPAMLIVENQNQTIHSIQRLQQQHNQQMKQSANMVSNMINGIDGSNGGSASAPLREFHQTFNLEELNHHMSKSFQYNTRFAEEMHERKCCHKTGGRSKHGHDGQIHKLIMACILHNTFAAFHYINASAPESTFYDKCFQLSDELFVHALSL